MICGIMANQGVASACAYPLNDDGTLAATLPGTPGYAGPSASGGQRIQFSTTGDFIYDRKYLMSSGAKTAARFARPSGHGIAFEASVNAALGANKVGLGILITNAAGTYQRIGVVETGANGDRLMILVTQSGDIEGGINSPYGSIIFDSPASPEISETDMFSPFLYVVDDQAGYTADITLLSDKADMIGSYPAGTTDICGTPL